MPLPQELIDDARTTLLRDIRTGFENRDEILESAIEYYSENADAGEIGEQLPRLFDAAARDHELDKQSWPDVTDCDRLDAAFDELNARGIMARHNFTCCTSCGHAQMPAEYRRSIRLDPNSKIRGYAFYHNQDTQRAAEGGVLYLAFGTTSTFHRWNWIESLLSRVVRRKTLTVRDVDTARTVVETLLKSGLATEWNGTADQRIAIQIDWKRRARPQRWCEE